MTTSSIEIEERSFRLGGVLVEPTLNRLSTPNRVVPVEPKVMRLLLCLASRRGDVDRHWELRDLLLAKPAATSEPFEPYCGHAAGCGCAN